MVTTDVDFDELELETVEEVEMEVLLLDVDIVEELEVETFVPDVESVEVEWAEVVVVKLEVRLELDEVVGFELLSEVVGRVELVVRLDVVGKIDGAELVVEEMLVVGKVLLLFTLRSCNGKASAEPANAAVRRVNEKCMLSECTAGLKFKASECF